MFTSLFCGRPIKNAMKNLNSPFLGRAAAVYVFFLALCFAGSIHMASQHRKHHDDASGYEGQGKLLNDSKRLRAERNSFLSFGSLFLALVLSQLWVLLKRVIDLVRHGCFSAFFVDALRCQNHIRIQSGRFIRRSRTANKPKCTVRW